MTFTSTLIDDLVQQALVDESEALQNFQQGIMNQSQRETIDRSLQERYGIEPRQFYSLPDETQQEYYSQAGQVLDIFEPTGDFDRMKSISRVRAIYDQYTRTPREELEVRDIDPEGAPFSVQETLADLPVGVDQIESANRALLEQFPGTTIQELDVSFEPDTNNVIFKNPETKQYTTINPVGNNWMEAAGRWMKLEGDAIMSSLVPGVLAGLGVGVVTKSPGLAQTAGVIADVGGYFEFRRRTLKDLRERGYLNKNEWTNGVILRQALSDSIPVGIGSVAGVALTRLLTAHIKRLPDMAINEEQLMKAIKEVYKSKGMPFYDEKSAIKYLYEKQLAGELPANMRGGDVPWEAYPTEDILDMARRIVDIEKPGAAIRPTTPQIMLEAAEKLNINISGAPRKTAETLQTALQAIRKEGGPLAQQVDEVISGQEKQMIQKYQKLLDEGLGTKEALKQLEGINTTKITGTALDLNKVLSEPQIARVNQATNEIQRLTDEAIDSIDNLTANRMTRQEAGTATREFFETQTREGEEIIDAFYNRLGADAGGAKPLYDPTSLIEKVKGIQIGESKKILQSFRKENPALDDILKLPKLKKTVDGRQYKNISYEQIKGMIEDVNGKLQEKLTTNEVRAYNSLKETLLDFRSSALSTQGDDIAHMARIIDDGYSVFKDTYKTGVINKITNARSGRYTTGEGSVMDALLLQGTKKDKETVKNIINGNTPGADVAKRNVQSWLEQELYALGRQADLSINPERITDAQLSGFLNKYGTLLDDYMPNEAGRIRNLPSLIKGMKSKIRKQEDLLKTLKNDPELGPIFDDVGRAQLSRDPNKFFSKLFGRGRFVEGGRTDVAVNLPALKKVVNVLKGKNNTVSKQVLKDLKMYAAKDLDDVISIKNAEGLIDPVLFKEYLTVMQEPLEVLFGKKFVKGLNGYERMIRYLMPKGTGSGAGAEAFQEALKKAQRDMIQVGNDVTRAYIGIFTRPGRFLTAFLRNLSTKQQKRLTNLMLNPDQITSEYAAKQFFSKPFVQMLARQWPHLIAGAKAPGDEKGSSQKLEKLVEEMKPELIEEEKIKFFNTGGRVKLMPLRYNL